MHTCYVWVCSWAEGKLRSWATASSSLDHYSQTVTPGGQSSYKCTHAYKYTYIRLYIHFPICMPASIQGWICFLQMALSNQNSIQSLHSHSIFFLTVFMAWVLTISLMWCTVYRASVGVCTMCVGGRAHQHSLLINIPKPLQTASQTGVSNCLPCVYTKGSFHTHWAFLIGRYVPILIGRYVPFLIGRYAPILIYR